MYDAQRPGGAREQPLPRAERRRKAREERRRAERVPRIFGCELTKNGHIRFTIRDPAGAEIVGACMSPTQAAELCEHVAALLCRLHALAEAPAANAAWRPS